MKKILPTIVAIAFVLSAVSCKENTSETTLEEVESIETPVEVIETPVLEEIDTTGSDTFPVDSTTVPQ